MMLQCLRMQADATQAVECGVLWRMFEDVATPDGDRAGRGSNKQKKKKKKNRKLTQNNASLPFTLDACIAGALPSPIAINTCMLLGRGNARWTQLIYLYV